MRREAAAGALAILPALAAAAPFGLLLGALAAQKGLSVAEVMAMSALVFAGGAQFVAVELWREPAPWLALGIAALLVNLRHVLMGASLAPKMRAFHPAGATAAMFFMTDEVWAMAEARARNARLTPAFYAGMAGALYLGWLITTGLGAAFGSAFGDPARLGFDFALPAVFIGLIAGFWNGAGTAGVLIASAAAATLAAVLLPSPWHIPVGGLAGCAVGLALARPSGDEA